MKLIFEYQGRASTDTIETRNAKYDLKLPESSLRKASPRLPNLAELQVVRHYTQLSTRNFSIDTHFYPLGSCTMKYNPRVAAKLASLSGFLNQHPTLDARYSQGFLSCVYELQNILCTVTGMRTASLAGMAGAQGEFAGVSMIQAYHQARGDSARREILVPDSAHGTNPASAVMCGYTVREIPTAADGDIDLIALREAVGPHTAGVMLTNPSTLGIFDRNIEEVAAIVHQAGGLLYYDGANLNAILGQVLPGDMGFDVMHINLHKTFATPHGGGGPGGGPILAGDRLSPYLPVPRVDKTPEGYVWLTQADCPDSIGPLSAFMGNAGIILRAYIYVRRLGREGLRRVSEYATLNANYMQARLQQAGFTLAYPERRASHEFIITFKTEAKRYNLKAMDIAKRLLDYGYHAPTTYFPLLVPECFLIEPTETESKETIDGFIDALIAIMDEVKHSPELVTGAPITLPVLRLDDVKAARELDLNYLALIRECP